MPVYLLISYIRKYNNINKIKYFSDEISANLLDTSKFILVDHHISPFSKQTIKVIDHRPFYPGSNLPTDCQVNITEVGSCATLIADLMLKSDNVDVKCEDVQETLKMLYVPIVLDTINFSKDADKAKPLDHMICDKLEMMLDFDEAKRIDLFNKLVNARADVSTLNSLQILSKDLKVISNFDGKRVIAIPGFPISVREYTNMLDAKENLLKFGEINHCDVIVLMGMKFVDGIVSRDVGVVNIKDHRLFDKILERLTNENSLLSLVPDEGIDFLDGKFYTQNNVKPSRKQILPMVKNVLDELYSKTQ